MTHSPSDPLPVRRCKIGDLALIVRFSYPGHARNLGKLVRIIGVVDGRTCWHAEVGPGFLWPDGLGSPQRFRSAVFLDSQLLPLPKLSAEDAVRSTVPASE